MELCWIDEGVECAEHHFVSDEMLELHVQALSGEGAGKHNGEVRVRHSR